MSKNKKVISLQGGMAAGKTTLARNLEKRFPEYYFSYENPLPQVKIREARNLDNLVAVEVDALDPSQVEEKVAQLLSGRGQA